MNRHGRRLTLVLLIVLTLAAAAGQVSVWVAVRERDRMVDRLTSQLFTGTDSEAIAALRQLEKLNELGIDALVAAASDSRPKIASAARQSIDDLLTRWHSELKGRGTSQLIMRRMVALADVLAWRVDGLSTDALAWSRRVTLRMLRLSKEVPAGGRVQLIAACERVLSSRPPVTAQVAGPVSQSPMPNEQLPPKVSVAALPADTMTNVAPAAELEEATIGALSLDNGVASPGRQRPLDTRPTPSVEEVVVRPESTPLRVGDLQFRPARRPAPTADPQVVEAPDTWNPDWQRPGESQSVDSDSADKQPSKEPLDSADSSVASDPGKQAGRAEVREPRPFDTWEIQELLASYARAEPEKVAMYREELLNRRFDPVPPRLVRSLLADDSLERERFVDDLLKTPGVAPGPWLMLLVTDPHADVRWKVLSLMATSHDAEILEKVWQVALRDSDPRIAGLVTRLQAKRNQAARRR